MVRNVSFFSKEAAQDAGYDDKYCAIAIPLKINHDYKNILNYS